MLNIFMLNNFFANSSIFWGNCKKQFWGRIWPFFRESGLLRQKINDLFYHELGNGYFIIEQVFWKKRYFWRKLRKTHLWKNMTLLDTNVALRNNFNYRFKSILSIRKPQQLIFIDNKNYWFLTALLWSSRSRLTLIHLMVKTSQICIFMFFLIFLYYNWLLYFPINKNFFWKRKMMKNPPPPV